MKFWKMSEQSQKKTFSECFDKIIARHDLRQIFWDNKKSDTILVSRKIVKYFKNESKINLSISPKLALKFKTQIFGTKIYMTPFRFCGKL